MTTDKEQEAFGLVLERHKSSASENDIRAAFQRFMETASIAALAETTTEGPPGIGNHGRMDLYVHNTCVEFKKDIVRNGLLLRRKAETVPGPVRQDSRLRALQRWVRHHAGRPDRQAPDLPDWRRLVPLQPGHEPGPDVTGLDPNPGPNKATGSSTAQATGYSRRTGGRGRICGAPPNRSASARRCQAQRGQDRQLPPHQIFTGNRRCLRPYFHHQSTQMGYD